MSINALIMAKLQCWLLANDRVCGHDSISISLFFPGTVLYILLLRSCTDLIKCESELHCWVSKMLIAMLSHMGHGNSFSRLANLSNDGHIVFQLWFNSRKRLKSEGLWTGAIRRGTMHPWSNFLALSRAWQTGFLFSSVCLPTCLPMAMSKGWCALSKNQRNQFKRKQVRTSEPESEALFGVFGVPQTNSEPGFLKQTANQGSQWSLNQTVSQGLRGHRGCGRRRRRPCHLDSYDRAMTRRVVSGAWHCPAGPGQLEVRHFGAAARWRHRTRPSEPLELARRSGPGLRSRLPDVTVPKSASRLRTPLTAMAVTDLWLSEAFKPLALWRLLQANWCCEIKCTILWNMCNYWNIRLICEIWEICERFKKI